MATARRQHSGPRRDGEGITTPPWIMSRLTIVCGGHCVRLTSDSLPFRDGHRSGQSIGTHNEGANQHARPYRYSFTYIKIIAEE